MSMDFRVIQATPQPACSPFMVFPVSAEPFFKAAMRGGCDPYNTVDAAEDALFDDLEREHDAASAEAEEACQDAWEAQYRSRVEG